jgi:hypothetical protein
LQAKTLFALLCDRAPGRYQPNQLRMLQRHIASRRALHAPEQEVIFVQVHQPGRMAQSDFTPMTDLGVILAGSPFPHLVYYLVLTYSSVDAVQICFSESFESLAEGLEACLWQIGGVPQFHRTDNLSPAVHVLDRGGRKQFTDRYQALMTHYGLQPTTNTPAEAHENGDVDKRTTASTRPSTKPAACAAAVTLWTAAYAQFLHDLVWQRNRTRRLMSLPFRYWAICITHIARELDGVRVGRKGADGVSRYDRDVMERSNEQFLGCRPYLDAQR